MASKTFYFLYSFRMSVTLFSSLSASIIFHVAGSSPTSLIDSLSLFFFLGVSGVWRMLDRYLMVSVLLFRLFEYDNIIRFESLTHYF